MGRLRARKSFSKKLLRCGACFFGWFWGALGVVERRAVGVRRGPEDAQHRAGEWNETWAVGEGGEEVRSGPRGDGDWGAAVGWLGGVDGRIGRVFGGSHTRRPGYPLRGTRAGECELWRVLGAGWRGSVGAGGAAGPGRRVGRGRGEWLDGRSMCGGRRRWVDGVATDGGDWPGGVVGEDCQER